MGRNWAAPLDMRVWMRVLVVVGLMMSATALAQCELFPESTEYPVGLGPISITSADLDSDGDLDLAVADYDDSQVSVLMNQGDGTFTDAANYWAWDYPRSIVAADLDGDGDSDLATTIYVGGESGAVGVSLNEGDGAFTASDYYYVQGVSTSLAAADFDGDGDVDLTASVFQTYSISLLMNKGDGAFDNYDYVGPVDAPLSVTAADMDGDGDPDLIVTNNGKDSVTIKLNNGEGEFPSGLLYSVGGDRPTAVSAADFDGDADLDLATANEWSNDVSVLLNKGDGHLFPAELYRVGSDPSDIRAGDLDGDGDADLAIAAPGSGEVSVLFNHGDGAFSEAVPYRAGDFPGSVVIGDLNGDGGLDLAVTNFESTVSVLLNQFSTYDCNANGIADCVDIFENTSADCTENGIPDECEADCNANNQADSCDVAGGSSADCNANQTPDECDIAAGASEDCARNGIPDECEPDCNADGIADECDIASGTSADCNDNLVPDECEVPAAYSGAGTALQFDGVNQYAEVSYTTGLNPASFTVEVWARVEGGAGTVRRLVNSTRQDAFGKRGYSLYATSENFWAFEVGSIDGWSQLLGPKVENEIWVHVAGTYDAGTDTLMLYLNGHPAVSAVDSGFAASYGRPLRIAAGDTCVSATEYLPGIVDEVRVWNVARSSEDILTDFQRVLEGTESGLVGYWQLSEGEGAIIGDSAGGDYAGALINSPTWIKSLDCPATVCDADANGDNIVNPLDAGYVQARFGCPVNTGDSACDAADQNSDGLVDPLDAGYVLARFGLCE